MAGVATYRREDGPPAVIVQPGAHSGGGDKPYGFTQAMSMLPPGSPPQGLAAPLLQQQQGYPPGLEPLAGVDHLFVKQDYTVMFSNNTFRVMSGSGAQLYNLEEQTSLLLRLTGCGRQWWSMALKDLTGSELLQLKSSPCLFGCMGGAGVIVTYQGDTIGTARYAGSISSPQYNICDQTGSMVLVVKSPGGLFVGATGTAEFPILTPNGQQVGRIAKQWSGFSQEFFTDADTFGVNFPLDLHVGMKAVLLATTILIDFHFFERN